MEESSSQKLAWDGDAKAVQQCLTDIFTSVYTTCDIPENAIFGPCVLSHTSLYDSIAFIALKSTDKRTAPYIFRVRKPPPPASLVHTYRCSPNGDCISFPPVYMKKARNIPVIQVVAY
ncbi:PR domain zinc finger protein 8 [Xenotaenia resolanae]|uniref:PR domain zinc finger protein 8 n=1 Tax=Xenotaenia resolanae TaxID=208358 RepID=A0ABV0WJI9_9TELE